MKTIKWCVAVLSLLVCLNAQASERLAGEANTIRIFQDMSPFVVNVHQVHEVPINMWQSQPVATGVGSGFIWNKSGYIVTNYHVIMGASKFAVTFYDNKTAYAHLIGVDRRRDIAVLKLDALSDLPEPIKRKQYFTVEYPGSVQVGQEAIAIGSPYGLSNSLTEGVVSAINRQVVGQDLGVAEDMIQTDASINPGNSGGPLLNSKGRLIGMNTMIYSNTGGSTGIGFAVPSSAIEKAVRYIVVHQKSISQVGIGIVSASDIYMQPGEGVMVARVLPNTPAARHHLRGVSTTVFGEVVPGDLIVSFNGKKIQSSVQLFHFFENSHAGSLVDLGIVRDGQLHQISIKLEKIV
jgi:S1-C subfamily serine protease